MTTVPMFEEFTTKKDLEQHLSKHHNRPWTLNSKSSKEEIEKWHARVHADAELGTDGQRKDALHYFRDQRLHTHGVMSLDDVAAHGFEPLQLEKPLTAAESASLKTLIDNDFDALQSDLRAMAGDAKRERLAEIEAEWSARNDKRAYYRDKRAALAEELRVKAQRIQDAAAKDGIKIDMQPNLATSEPVLVGKSDALREAAAEVDRDLQRALNTLNRQRLAAHRVVGLARITPAAQEVLKSIPTAKTLMVEASKERMEVSA